MVSDTEGRAQRMIECRAGFLLGCSRTRAAWIGATAVILPSIRLPNATAVWRRAGPISITFG